MITAQHKRLSAGIDFRATPVAGNSEGAKDNLTSLRKFIYLYFWLLIFEGAVRKWILPGFSDYLLIIRDPVALGILWLGISKGVLRSSKLLFFAGALALAFALLGLIQSMNGLEIIIMGYGYRTYFLHLPVIFIMGEVLRPVDVQRLSRWICLVAIGMVPLLVWQFFSSPDALVNTVAGGEGLQLDSALGKIRVPGTFSFILGIVNFYALAFAIALAAELQPGLVVRKIRYGALTATFLVAAIAGSRALLVALAIVLAALLLVALLSRRLGARVIWTSILLTLLLSLIGVTSIFRSGIDVLSSRVNQASVGGNPVMNLVIRIGESFIEGADTLKEAKFEGAGMGLGTNAGSKVKIGVADFLLAEGEWPRVILEVGPFFGAAYITWRIALTLSLFFDSVKMLRVPIVLPFLIWSGCVGNLLIGQWGPPTNLGFAVFGAGLALASMHIQGGAAPSHRRRAGSRASGGVGVMS